MKLNTFLIGLLAYVLTSCGGSLAPLTAEQKARFNKAVSETASVADSSQKVAKKKQGLSSLDSTFDARASMFGAALADTSSEFEGPDAGLMEDALGSCQGEFESNDSEGGGGIGGNLASMKLKFSLYGADCPVAMNLALQGKQEITSDSIRITMGLDTKFAILSEEFKRYTDVTEFEMNVKLAIEAQQNTGSGKGTISGNGYIQSKSEGRINIAIAGRVEGTEEKMTGELAARFEFSDFVAEYKVVADENGEKVYLNGEEIEAGIFERDGYENIEDPNDGVGDWFGVALN